MKEKRVLAVILAVTLFFSGCGKSDEQGQNDVSEAMTDNIIDDGDTSEEQQEKHDISTLKVSYDQNDGLNPYEVKSQLNSLLTPLIFDGLVKVGTNFKAFNCIAREITKQGNIVTVKLESDATFSDNSKVTADDVIASFDAAKASSTKYAFNLKKVSSAKKISDDTIAFELSEDSKNYQNLFNFPIIKTNNGDVIGCGRYVFVKNPNGSYLEKSKYNGNYSEKNYPVEKIELVEADGKSSPSFKINMNEIDISYNKIELKNDKAVTLPYVLVPTNDLIYIGVNSQVGYMSNNQFKQGIFSSLDVSKIGVYVSLREEDFGNSFLNPQFYKAQPQKQNLIEAKKTFEALGYKSLKAGEIRIGADKKPVSLKLLINEENKERNMMAQEIKRQLLDVG
ncbi:MAG: ABC transporter substrate-binding protein, partial [Oscillospiraceae bacterium]